MAELQTRDYAVTGTSSSGGITYTFILRVTENSTNVQQNTSNLTVKAILRQSYSGNAFINWGTGVSCTLNGKEIFSDYQQRALSGTGETVYYTWTGNVAHNSDGTLRLKVGGKLWQNSSASYTPPALTITESDSKAMVLTAIPRASTLGATDAYIGANSTVSVNRTATGFSHVIAWKFGGISGYIGADWKTTASPTKLTATSISFQVPEAFYAQIPDADSGTCTLTITTYSGDSQVGDPQATTFTARANQTVCAPEVTGTAVDVNKKTLALTGDEKRLVRFFSTARCTVTAEAKNSATVKQLRIDGKTPEGDTLDIANVETADIVFTAVDSRDFPGTDTDEVLTLIPYIRLTNKAVCKRLDPTSGRATLTFEGDWFSGSFGAEDNKLTLSYRLNGGEEITVPAKLNGDKYTATVTLEGLAYQQSHTVTVTVRDELDSAVKTLQVAPGIPVFDWGESDFRFHVPVIAPQLLLEVPEAEGHVSVDYIVEAGTDGIWTYEKWSGGKAVCRGVLEKSNVVNSSSSLFGTTTVDFSVLSAAFPNLFVSVPLVFVTANDTGGGLVAASNDGSTAGSCKVAVFGYSEAIGTVNVYAIGKWK